MTSYGIWTGRAWSVTISALEVTVVKPSGTLTVPQNEATSLEVRTGWFRRELRRDGRTIARLRGISKPEALRLQIALRQMVLLPELKAAVEWRAQVERLLGRARADQRWVSAEVVDGLLASRPQPSLSARTRAAGTGSVLTPAESEAVDFLGGDLANLVASTNEEILAAELLSRREFFATIEKTPLTDEQARAVAYFDNRVQVLAAAGSGKTSVMVARAAYAVHRGFVSPERILLLAFNRAAADELQERVEARFAAAGISSAGVRALTFHSFGLDVIGRATGERPRPAPWLDRDVEMVERIVDDLRDSSGAFRYQWDLYRLLFAQAPVELTQGEPDGYDRSKKASGYETFGGDVVKSHGERLVADFLFVNGVNYVYEQRYPHDVADAEHSQYRPDFYYPDIDLWHEHWALDREGNPPAEFAGYAQTMAWKRQVHRRYGTSLIETTWADVVFGDGLSSLAAELTRRGLSLDWDPGRPPRSPWARPMEHRDLARLVRTFMAHVKSGSWTREQLEEKMAGRASRLGGYRSELFMDVYWPVHREWDRRLAAEGFVDFEDMLVQAAAHLEAGLDMGYDMVLVDEMQDASRARARLVRGLLGHPGRYLLGVGDDWQSINRFAGADLSVMTRFEDWFGNTHRLELATTFRCPQNVCDVARSFVARNPDQSDKAMRSSQPGPGAAVKVICADDQARALAGYLRELSAGVTAGLVPVGASGRAGVKVLGRYHFDRDLLPGRRAANLDVSFATVHASKGLEADYVVVVNMTTGSHGFPSNIADDPVLRLAMPVPEAFPHAEERRLLYVALTRARREVALLTTAGRMSPFVVELLDGSYGAKVELIGAGSNGVEVCPECGKGTMVRRKGRLGAFLGCSAFPACRYTQRL